MTPASTGAAQAQADSTLDLKERILRAKKNTV